MKAPETIQTKRLLLRKPHVEDASAIFEGYTQDPEVTRYLVWKPYKKIQEMEKVGMERESLLRRYILHPNISAEPRDVYMYAIVR